MGFSVDPVRWPGGDRLSRILGCSTMGAGVFHGRVRDGIGCIISAMTTGPPGRSSWGSEGDGTDEVCRVWWGMCVGWFGRVLRGLVLRAAGGFSCEDPGRCGGGELRSIGRLGPLS